MKGCNTKRAMQQIAYETTNKPTKYTRVKKKKLQDVQYAFTAFRSEGHMFTRGY